MSNEIWGRIEEKLDTALTSQSEIRRDIKAIKDDVSDWRADSYKIFATKGEVRWLLGTGLVIASIIAGLLVGIT